MVGRHGPVGIFSKGVVVVIQSGQLSWQRIRLVRLRSAVRILVPGFLELILTKISGGNYQSRTNKKPSNYTKWRKETRVQDSAWRTLFIFQLPNQLCKGPAAGYVQVELIFCYEIVSDHLGFGQGLICCVFELAVLCISTSTPNTGGNSLKLGIKHSTSVLVQT